MAKIQQPPATVLSALTIDGNKDWGGYRIDNLGDPNSGDDAMPADLSKAITGRIGKAFLEWTASKLLLGAGSGLDPTEIDPTYIATGNYTGDNTEDRAIPHGLPVKPKFVFITRGNSNWEIIVVDTKLEHQGSSVTSYTVTAKDSTNFYVGDAASYPLSSNGNALVYYWVAIG